MRVVLLLGPDEAEQGKVTIKDLSSGTQEVKPRAEVPEAIKRILERR